jgi:hypothetical protein
VNRLLRRVQRDERGMVTDLILAGIIVGVVLTLSGVGLLAAPTIDKWRDDRRAARQGREVLPNTPPARVIPEVFRDFGAPPSENPQCVADVLASYYPTLKWNGFSWVDSSDPAPPANSTIASEWRGRMKAKVGALFDLFGQQNCDKPPVADLPPPAGPTDDPAAELTGTYTLVQTGNPTTECNQVLPTTMRVSFQNASDMNVTLTSSGSDGPSGSYLALLNSGRNFRFDAPEKYFAMNGTFITRSSEIIVEGVFSYSVGGGCGIPYEGTKSR